MPCQAHQLANLTLFARAFRAPAANIAAESMLTRRSTSWPGPIRISAVGEFEGTGQDVQGSSAGLDLAPASRRERTRAARCTQFLKNSFPQAAVEDVWIGGERL